jgi:dipeptidyl-peptidase-4
LFNLSFQTAKWKIVVLVCAAAAITCDAKTISSKQSTKTPFEFDEVIPNRYGQRGFSGTWISGKEFTYTTGGNFVKYNVETNETVTILSSQYISAQSWSGPSFRFSADLTRILVRYSDRQIFRHSTVAKYSIIYPSTDRPEYKIAAAGEIQIAFFSPNGNGLSYIQDNNIYYIDFETDELPKVITGDGVPGVIYNGIPDWVYEEEVLGTDAASWFSPNGKNLAFIRFDDREVREAVYDLYGEGDQQYPEEVHLRYPKVMLTSSHVSHRY